MSLSKVGSSQVFGLIFFEIHFKLKIYVQLRKVKKGCKVFMLYIFNHIISNEIIAGSLFYPGGFCVFRILPGDLLFWCTTEFIICISLLSYSGINLTVNSRSVSMSSSLRNAKQPKITTAVTNHANSEPKRQFSKTQFCLIF